MVTTSEHVEVSERPAALYLTKPYAYRVKEPLVVSPGTPRYQELTKVQVGGANVAFNGDKGHLVLGGLDYDVYQWLELKHRIDSVFERTGLLQRVKPASGEWDGESSKFLTRNWRAVANQQDGTWKRPPWFLRWLWAAVITKEPHGY